MLNFFDIKNIFQVNVLMEISTQCPLLFETKVFYMRIAVTDSADEFRLTFNQVFYAQVPEV